MVLLPMVPTVGVSGYLRLRVASSMPTPVSPISSCTLEEPTAREHRARRPLNGIGSAVTHGSRLARDGCAIPRPCPISSYCDRAIRAPGSRPPGKAPAVADFATTGERSTDQSISGRDSNRRGGARISTRGRRRRCSRCRHHVAGQVVESRHVSPGIGVSILRQGVSLGLIEISGDRFRSKNQKSNRSDCGNKSMGQSEPKNPYRCFRRWRGE